MLSPANFATLCLFFSYAVSVKSDHSTVSGRNDSGAVLSSSQDLSIEVGSTGTVSFKLKGTTLSTNVIFVVEVDGCKGDNGDCGDKYAKISPTSFNMTPNEWDNMTVTAKAPVSRAYVQAINCSSLDTQSTPTESTCPIRLTEGFVRLHLMRSRAAVEVSMVVGWIYFLAWSVSFYPQLYLNWRRKSVYGLNFDFLALNLTGFICYTIYTCSIFWPSAAQTGYFAANPRGKNPVQLNDVFFTIHAVIITLLTIIQCFIYERRGQRVSRICWIILAVLWGVFLASLISALAHVGRMDWFHFVSIVSYLKIAVTLIKYIPQAYQNYRRKSTVGWSIGNVLLDFTGGSMSIAQMFLQSWNFEDWNELFLDPTKFWLGALSIIFDTIFILQHYVLYRHARQGPEEEYKSMEEEEAEEEGHESTGPGYGSVEDPAEISAHPSSPDPISI